MADFWNAFRTGQEARSWWDDRHNRRAERDARMAQRGALRQEFGDRGGGNVDDSLALRGDDRVQTEFDAGRQRQAAIAALSAYQGMVQRQEGDGLRVDPEQQRVFRGAAFDRIQSVLPALGVDASQVPVLREMLMDDPQRAGELIRALRASDGQAPAYAPRAVIGPDGRAQFVAPGDEVGREPADDYLAMGRLAQGDERLELGRETLDHRQAIDDPDYQRRRSAAQSEGREVGEIAAQLPAIRERADHAIGALDTFLQNPNRDSIFGLPNLSRLDTGGFGAAGVVPGTPAADALAQFNAAAGVIQGSAMDLLQGQTPISDADREAAAASLAVLSRNTSPQEAVRALESLRAFIQRNVTRAEEAAQAGVTGRSNAERPPQGGRRGPSAPAPAAPPAGGIRNNGETADDLLNRLGL